MVLQPLSRKIGKGLRKGFRKRFPYSGIGLGCQQAADLPVARRLSWTGFNDFPTAPFREAVVGCRHWRIRS